ncbi:MAG: phosphodiester glycosidase family protein, partial [Bacteroidota bacterium]|nr:phosphodiester glycosidase family protein [Bacteroidota bacterium]
MKKLLLLFSVFMITNLKAQIVLDTLSSRYIGPGVQYSDIIARSVPWTIKVLRVDLKNKNISMEAVKAKESYFGYERTSAMSKRRNYDGHQVVGAINADYYNTSNGSITNIQIGNGQIYRGPIKSSLIGFDINNKPMIDICSLDAKVFYGGQSLKINEVNQSRGANQLILYNFYKGTSTDTDTSGNEALIRPLSNWLVNDTIKCVIESIENKKGNMTIPSGKAILSGNGSAASFIADNFHVGDTVKLYMGITTSLKKIKELVGGHPRLVNNGVNYLETALKYESGSSTTTREPRSAAGISQDSTYLYLITLDGRQSSSAGATLSEFADLLIKLGVYHGFNLDGGGSTTMVVRNEVMNSPSDGNERSVSNCLLVVSSAPFKPDSLKRFAFTYKYDKFNIYSVDRIKLSVYANDVNDNPSQIDSSSLSFNISSGLGTIDKNGLFTASKLQKSGYIYAKYKGFTDSSFISIIPVTKMAMLPKTSTIDATTPLKLSLK